MQSIILLDTNVVSEMMRETPDQDVVRWYLRQSSASLYATTITLSEIRYGLALMPKGKRREALSRFANDFFQIEMAGKILPFDQEAAVECGRIRASRAVLGKPMPPLDAQIAAIGIVHRAAIATRNTSDFKECGIALVNPWKNTST